jgi:hypothetical protein
MYSFQELNQDVTWAKEQVDLAKDNVMNWKPSYSEYEDAVCEIIDHEYPSVLGFKASDILKRMDWSQYDTVCERTFQYHYDRMTEERFNELLSELREAELRLERAENELVTAIDRQTETVD